MLDGIKTAIEGFSGFDRDVLHVHLGMSTMLVAVLVTRRRAALLGVVLALLLAALANEIADYRRILAADDPFRPAEAVRDVFNTVAWPLVLAVLAGERRPGR